MGQALNAVIMGAADSSAPPILIAHGLFGSARNWGVIQKKLAASRTVISVDMRNHGDSLWSDDHSYQAMAEDLAGTIAAHGGVADVIGHSMGGKAAMVLAQQAPRCLRKLLVADIAPVAYGHSQLPLIGAMQALDLSGISRRSEADKGLQASIPEAAVRAFLLQSLRLSPGKNRWALNLAALAANMDRIMGFPALDGRFEGKTLMLRGGRSDYVLPAHEATIRRLFPNAEIAEIGDAGHWLHAEAPAAFIEAAREFLT